MDVLLNQPTGDVYRFVDDMTDRVLRLAVQKTPVGTGDMKRKNRSRIFVRRNRRVRGRIQNTDRAAWWVNRGTGVFNRDGPRGPIRPRVSSVLRFPARRYPDPQTGNTVYRAQVRGQPAQEFLWEALRIAAMTHFYRGRRQFWGVVKHFP